MSASLTWAPAALVGDLMASDSMSDSGASGAAGQGGGAAGGGGGMGPRDAQESMAEIAAALGITPEDVFMDRVRVERRSLEKLILGEDEIAESADSFFQNIMDRTHTRIVWPAHLKIGSRSRKSPHVVIAGLFDDVLEAKKEVIGKLDSPDDRVTMKLDLSYLYHSHMIGRGGHVIKKVMDETGTHIHFPDSNRNSTVDKSSQVSLAGRLEGVEQARQRVRNLMPLVFFFDAPALDVSGPDAASPFVLGLQQKYHVQVRFRQRHRLHGVQVQVKGSEWEVDLVTEATLLLTSHLGAASSAPERVSVYTTLEVSPNHQPLVLGTNCSNIKMIMKNTGTQIMVPDLKDPNIPSLKKNIITVIGPIRNVYLARQQLLGSLPILLMFEVSDYAPLDYDHATEIMKEFDVHINFRRKEKQRTIAITVKGIERDATNVYDARRQLLGLEGHRVVADIPDTYNIPDAPPVFSTMFLGRRGGITISNGADARGRSRSIGSGRRRLPTSPTSPDTTAPSPWLSPYDQLSRNMGALVRRRVGAGAVMGAAVGAQPCAGQCTAPCGAPCSGGLSGSHSSLLSLASSLASSASGNATHRPDSGYAASSSTASSLAPSPCPGGGSGRVSPASVGVPDSSAAVSPTRGPAPTPASASTVDSPAASPREAHSPVSAVSVASAVSAISAISEVSATSSTSAAAVATTVTPPVIGWPSPASSDSGDAASDLHTSPNLLYGPAVNGGLFPDMVRCPDRRAPGYEKKTLEYAASASDYRRQMAVAYKAMQEQPVPTQPRVPTPVWSGMGFSHSSPVASPTKVPSHNPMNAEAQALWRSSPSGSLAPRLAAMWHPSGGGDSGVHEEGLGAGAGAGPGAGLGTRAAAGLGSESVAPQPSGDIVTLLTALGLQKYIDVFQREEIDLQAFRALTETDLLDIGVVAVGTRRKMLDAISELRASHASWRHLASSHDSNNETATMGGRLRDGSPSLDRW